MRSRFSGDAQVSDKHKLRGLAKWTPSALGFAAGAYGAYVAAAWIGYGRPARPTPAEADALLDRFMPSYEVAERYHIRVGAPAKITFAAACEMDLMRSPIIQTIFRTRELVLGSEPAQNTASGGMLEFTKSIGWSVLAEITGREIVMGAVTQPWNANPVSRPLLPGEFAAFQDPEYVKIAWTLRADPDGENHSIFRHETRVVTTDRVAWRKFRDYWALFSPGIKLIRFVMLKPLCTEAEGRATRSV